MQDTSDRTAPVLPTSYRTVRTTSQSTLALFSVTQKGNPEERAQPREYKNGREHEVKMK